MNVHKIARLTPSGRAPLASRVSRGWTAKAAAEAAGVSVRTARMRVDRHRRAASEGIATAARSPDDVTWARVNNLLGNDT